MSAFAIYLSDACVMSLHEVVLTQRKCSVWILIYFIVKVHALFCKSKDLTLKYLGFKLALYVNHCVHTSIMDKYYCFLYMYHGETQIF